MVEDQTIKGALSALRNAVVFEKEERTNAPFEAKRQAEERIASAHQATVRLCHLAHQAGVSKTKIAEQLGIKSINRVTQLIEEGKTNNKETTEA